MEKLSLKERLERYLRRNPQWVASGTVQRLVAEKTTYTPRTVVRRLEELENDGIIEVKYVKGHAWYKIAQTLPTKAQSLDVLSPADQAYWQSIPQAA